MKTKTYGSYIYFVTMYFINDNNELDVETNRWSKAKYAFDEAKRHEAKHGINTAFVFKARACRQIED